MLSTRPLTNLRTASGSLLALSVVIALIAVGCGGAEERTRTGSVGSGGEATVGIETPELNAVDERLDSLEGRTTATTDRIDTLQARVADEMGPEANTANVSLELTSEQTYVEIDERSLLAVNGIRMTRDEFANFTTTRGKTICSPAPTLAVHPDANYEVAMWALERIYDEGCQNVDLLDLE